MKAVYEKLYHDIEKNHFWFKGRRDYILKILEKTPKGSRILDIGCSSGLLLNELATNGFNIDNLYGIDISEKAVENCKKNGIDNAYVMDAQNIELPKKFDIIIASDCLEHLKEDDKALSDWHQLLNDNGILLVFVPAFMLLWSNHDVVNMHFRRYTQKQLIKKLGAIGFVITKSSYWNFFLFIPALVIRLLKRVIPKKSTSTSGDLVKTPLLNSLFYQLIKLENKLLASINFPFGVSAFCIAKKNSTK